MNNYAVVESNEVVFKATSCAKCEAYTREQAHNAANLGKRYLIFKNYGTPTQELRWDLMCEADSKGNLHLYNRRTI